MASLATDLRSAMVLKLRKSEAFSTAVGGRILDEEPRELPCAWIAVTEATDDTGPTDLLATVHVWERSDRAEASRLIDEVVRIFAEPPSMDAALVSWSPDYSEIRQDEEHAAYHGLVRFKARGKRE